ncbi:transglutaminase domain-containing protein [Pelagicoccus sp. SDUM812005]|uniref:transglutaminase domain-containing protein n=1 Tax=Pelagicoccus sp. SDUM812005 TaxID=3041257 RepID=UPI00280D3997|nr:transglutaminase domain-containing protein [Pelagicoccus sp. SDUM812005]MDQ8182696.1 transglutaminase domain-containing protein [Pelagicoccus sp. SDUM812005]
MTPPNNKLWRRPDINLSYWLALSSALIAFSIVSEKLLLAAFVGLGAIALSALSPNIPKRLRYAAQASFTLVAYFAALLPLWPEPYSAYYYTPVALVLGVALVAALNHYSYGGSRGVTSIAAIAFLLFIRNIVLYFHFEAPLEELGFSLAFVGLMEIALSPRFRNSEDHPHPELIFGLLLALVASFRFTSLSLGIVLSTLPILAFLIRNHELAKIPNEQVKPATLLSPPSRPRRKQLTTCLLSATPLLLAALLYLATLQVPFWGDFLPRDAPYLAQSIAQKASVLSQASNLDDEALSEAAGKIVDPQFFKQKAEQIAQSWKSTPREDSPLPDERQDRPTATEQSSATPQRQARPYDPDNYEYRLGPFARNRAGDSSSRVPSPATPGNIASQFPRLSEPGPRSESGRSFDPSNPPTPAGLNPGIPDGIGYGDALPDEFATPDSASNFDLASSSETSPDPGASPASPTEDFEQFLDAFEQPEKAITQALNLEGSDVSALLNEEALAIVKLDSTRAAPRRLYLRSNVLDTVDRFGLGAIRGQDGRVTIPVDPQSPLVLRSFRQSKSEASSLTITADRRRSATLPLPESFGRIQVYEETTLNIYPEERVAIAPRSPEPLTYRVFEADLEVTDRDRTKASASEAYRQRMLEIPLREEDRNYLEKLAKRVGGSRSPTRQFAYRFGNYFANRHPYSYFVDIPPGPGHAVVRWLENKSPGLCSNYAAAFVLLARSRGIPARVVGGFASDEFDSKELRFIMRQRNAHAWVEYLDESNQWIRFDPTPGISEAEIRRAEQYVNDRNPQSLRQLLLSEKRASQAVDPETPEEDALASPYETAPAAPPAASTPSLPERNAQDPVSAPRPSPSLVQSALSQDAPPSPSDSIPPSSTKSTLTSPKSEPRVAPPPETPLSQANDALSATPPASAEKQDPPWLALLAILAIVIPGIAYLMRFKKPQAATPELQLRHQAGRLLAQLDQLLQEHELSQDPIWIETRQSLSQQRYGRETSPLMVQDLAVKVALLAKRKKK